MRIDKYLKISRILKRRTVANEAVKSGRVTVNGREVKPSYDLKIGDNVEIGFGENKIKFKVLEIKDVVKKNEVENLYEIIND